MSRKFEVVMVVITRERITVKAIDAKTGSISEEYGRKPDGEPDYISGNFEDEPDLPDGLMEALVCLQGPSMAVMEELIGN